MDKVLKDDQRADLNLVVYNMDELHDLPLDFDEDMDEEEYDYDPPRSKATHFYWISPFSNELSTSAPAFIPCEESVNVESESGQGSHRPVLPEPVGTSSSSSSSTWLTPTRRQTFRGNGIITAQSNSTTPTSSMFSELALVEEESEANACDGCSDGMRCRALGSCPSNHANDSRRCGGVTHHVRNPIVSSEVTDPAGDVILGVTPVCSGATHPEQPRDISRRIPRRRLKRIRKAAPPDYIDDEFLMSLPAVDVEPLRGSKCWQPTVQNPKIPDLNFCVPSAAHGPTDRSAAPEDGHAGPRCEYCEKSQVFSCPLCHGCQSCCSCENSKRCPTKDIWYRNNNFHVRQHVEKRNKLFKPFPGEGETFTHYRRTIGVILHENGRKEAFVHEDNWRSDSGILPLLKGKLWRGATTFRIADSVKACETDVAKEHSLCPHNNADVSEVHWYRRRVLPHMPQLVEHAVYQRNVSSHWTHKLKSDTDYTVVECCCGKNSALGQSGDTNSKSVRITQEDDLTSTNGLQMALDPLNDPANFGFPIAWYALPCTWGSTARNMNSAINPESYNRASERHWSLFEQLFPATLVITHEYLLAGGDIVFEWPTDNYYWRLLNIQLFCAVYKLLPVEINGCMLGMADAKGLPLKKPWTLMTTMPSIYESFKDSICDGKHLHGSCLAGEAPKSSYYSDGLRLRAHQAFRGRVEPLYADAGKADILAPAEVTLSADGVGPNTTTNERLANLSFHEGHLESAQKAPYQINVFSVRCKNENHDGTTAHGLADPSVVPAGDTFDYSDCGSEPGSGHSTPMPGLDSGSSSPTLNGSRVGSAHSSGQSTPDVPYEEFTSSYDHAEALSSRIQGLINSGFLSERAHWFNDCDPDLKDVLLRAAAAKTIKVKGLPDIFDVEAQWLMDTGCGHDLLRRELAEAYQRFIVDVDPITFGTAAGPTETARALQLTLKACSGPHLITKITPYILRDTPSVLTIGARCMDYSFAFIWLPGRTPCLITPAFNIIMLRVIANIPYLDKGYFERSAKATSEQIRDATGIEYKKGMFQISRTISHAASATEVVTTSSAQTDISIPSRAEASIGPTDPYMEMPVDGEGEASTSFFDAACYPLLAPCLEDDGSDSDGSYGLSNWSSADADTWEPIEEEWMDYFQCFACPSPVVDIHDLGDGETVLPRTRLDKFDCVLHEKPRKGCLHCMRAYTTRKRHYARKLRRPVMAFGELVTCDHVVMKDGSKRPGIGHLKDMLNY